MLELPSNALDEWLAGRATNIRVDTATLDRHRPHVHLGGPGGLGLGPVCALSERLDVDTADGVERIEWAWSRGEPLGEPKRSAANGRRGTRIRVVPDVGLYPHEGGNAIDVRWRPPLSELALQLADLAPGLVMHVGDRRCASTGLAERAHRLGASAWRPFVDRTITHDDASRSAPSRTSR